jgi:hypothetical protein
MWLDQTPAKRGVGPKRARRVAHAASGHRKSVGDVCCREVHLIPIISLTLASCLGTARVAGRLCLLSVSGTTSRRALLPLYLLPSQISCHLLQRLLHLFHPVHKLGSPRRVSTPLGTLAAKTPPVHSTS